MKLYDPNNSEIMNVSAIEQDGDNLVIKGKVFGAMPMTAKLRPSEARAALKLLNWKLILFMATLLIRRDDR